MIKINFWSKDTGNLMSAQTGLTAEEIQGIKELKEGDRIILWLNKRETERQPSYTLKKYFPKEK